MKPFEIKGKTVLVTGATSGIGKATAVAFARQGSRIALVGRDPEKLANALKEIRESSENTADAEAFQLDLTRLQDVPRTIRAVNKKFGSVDVLVNNAAYAVAGLIEDCPVEQVKKNFEVNFFSVWSLIQQVLPAMKEKKSGQIINISSGVGKRALPGFSPYSTSKFALNGLTESLRLEVKPYGIDVILISPGRVSSNFHHRIEFYGRWKMNLSPMKMRSPEHIAGLILRASKNRTREAVVWGPGLIGAHLNYWAPRFVDFLLAKKYPVS